MALMARFIGSLSTPLAPQMNPIDLNTSNE